jgi:hypothetical protein
LVTRIVSEHLKTIKYRKNKLVLVCGTRLIYNDDRIPLLYYDTRSRILPLLHLIHSMSFRIIISTTNLESTRLKLSNHMPFDILDIHEYVLNEINLNDIVLRIWSGYTYSTIGDSIIGSLFHENMCSISLPFCADNFYTLCAYVPKLHDKTYYVSKLLRKNLSLPLDVVGIVLDFMNKNYFT